MCYVALCSGHGMRFCVNNTIMCTRRVMVMNVSHINIFKAPNLFLHWEYFQFIPPICFSHVFNDRPQKVIITCYTLFSRKTFSPPLFRAYLSWRVILTTIWGKSRRPQYPISNDELRAMTFAKAKTTSQAKAKAKAKAKLKAKERRRRLAKRRFQNGFKEGGVPVSYTHLTLPPIYSV